MNGERIAAVLDQARELGDEGRHWCKGRNWHKATGRYCIRGLIAKVITGDPYGKSSFVTAVYDWAARFLNGPDVVLSGFNDAPERTWADVDRLLQTAAREARG